METIDKSLEEELKTISELRNIKCLSGPILQKEFRFRAQNVVNEPSEELKLILNLVESHEPGLRLRAEIECDSNSYENKTENSKMRKEYLNPFSSDIDVLVEKVAELPKEWCVVQMTPQFSSDEIFAINSDDLTLNGVHITVFKCGEKDEVPYCVTLPRGNAYSIRGDMKRLKANLKEIYSDPFKKGMGVKSRKIYHKRRSEMEDVLECLLKEIEESWLGDWKCLFIGKYVDTNIETEIQESVKKFLKKNSLEISSNKILSILIQMVKSMISCNSNESATDKCNARILDYCFPGKNLNKLWNIFWKEHSIKIRNPERLPVILIVDEALDAFPWEMISTLDGHPSSRMSSLHLLYAVYKAHEDSIVDGYKIVSDFSNGKFILNPGLDLALMEKRLNNFFGYWLPGWDGIVGKTPTCKEFMEALTTAGIFCYSGHGSGAQYCSSEKIQKEKIESIVMLFGCGSTQLVEQGPSVEMYGIGQMYSLAGCPCLIGMLWVVTDIDTDLLTTTLLSTWIPNAGKQPWQHVDEKEWIEKGTVSISESDETNKEINNEPNLLKALCLAKNKMKHKCNKAAVVARGIPVKLKVDENIPRNK